MEEKEREGIDLVEGKEREERSLSGQQGREGEDLVEGEQMERSRPNKERRRRKEGEEKP